jgi:phosphate-selective porin OprO and OprP
VKLYKRFGPFAAAVLLSLSGAAGIYAQDMSSTPAASAATPAAAPATGAAPEAAKPKETTREEIKLLQDKNQDLENRIKALEDKEAAAPSNAPSNASSNQVGPMGSVSVPEGTFAAGVHDVSVPFEAGNEVMYSESRYMSFTNASGSMEFRIGGYEWEDVDINNQTNSVSNAVTTYDYVNGNPANNTNGFFERKAHLDFRGTFDKMFGAAIGIESDKSTGVSLGLYHAYFYAKFDKLFTVEGGKMTNPLSLEGDQPSADLPFVEASMLADLTINKVLGLMAEGKVNHFMEYNLMVDNGAQDNESSATGPPKPSGDMKDLTGRLFFTPWEKSDDEWLSGLGFGVAGSVDNETNEDTAPWAKIETSIGGNAFATYNSITPDGPFYHVDAQGYYYNGPFGFLAEHVDSIQTVLGPTPNHAPPAQPIQLDNSAWVAEAQWVFGGKAGFEGATVDNPFNPAKGKWGALELVARFQNVTLDVRSFDSGFPYSEDGPLASGFQTANAYGVGFNWWLTENFKIMCDGEETDCSGGNVGPAFPAKNNPFGTKYNSEQIMVARAALIM